MIWLLLKMINEDESEQTESQSERECSSNLASSAVMEALLDRQSATWNLRLVGNATDIIEDNALDKAEGLKICSVSYIGNL